MAVSRHSSAGGRKATRGCPCGYLGSREYQCRCSPARIEAYLGKISGPLIDRIAIHGSVRPVELEAYKTETVRGSRDDSHSLRAEVERGRAIQRERYGRPGMCNARAPERLFKQLAHVEREAEELLFRAQRQLRISARGRGHIMRVARTIADLEGADTVAAHHVAEAIQYRMRNIPV